MQMLGTWLVAFQDIRPDGGRNPIGRRTESDWAAYANGGKNLKIKRQISVYNL